MFTYQYASYSLCEIVYADTLGKRKEGLHRAGNAKIWLKAMVGMVIRLAEMDSNSLKVCNLQSANLVVYFLI